MANLSLGLDRNGGAIGLDHIGGNDVFGEGGRMDFCLLTSSNCNTVFSFLSLCHRSLISSISELQLTSDWVTWDIADVNSINVGSSWSSSVSTVSADLIVLETRLLLVTLSLPRLLSFRSGRGLKDPSLKKATLTTFYWTLSFYCYKNLTLQSTVLK